MSLHIDYKKIKTRLCEIGAKYDLDKSSQRKMHTPESHCYPYTIVYDSLFKNNTDAPLHIAEIGMGNSLFMWKEYFKNATIYGFDNDAKLLNSLHENYNTDRIILSAMDVKNQSSIQYVMDELNTTFDVIIDDSTNNFDDRIRILETMHSRLNPGGIFVLEDIDCDEDEGRYLEKLSPILQNFQKHYFVTVKHERLNVFDWNNNKLLILVKNGEPIFRPTRKMTIITPSCRPQNLIKLKESIDFNYVDEWKIVYDGTKINRNYRLFNNEKNPKIKEYNFVGIGKSGNPQRNYALDRIENTDTFIYYLDDDNVIHPDLYKLLDVINHEVIYTFDLADSIKVNDYTIKQGNQIELRKIDIAMFLIHWNLCKNIRWNYYEYAADGLYMEDCYKQNMDRWVYVNNEMCYYNKL